MLLLIVHTISEIDISICKTTSTKCHKHINFSMKHGVIMMEKILNDM